MHCSPTNGTRSRTRRLRAVPASHGTRRDRDGRKRNRHRMASNRYRTAVNRNRVVARAPRATGIVARCARIRCPSCTDDRVRCASCLVVVFGHREAVTPLPPDSYGDALRRYLDAPRPSLEALRTSREVRPVLRAPSRSCARERPAVRPPWSLGGGWIATRMRRTARWCRYWYGIVAVAQRSVAHRRPARAALQPD